MVLSVWRSGLRYRTSMRTGTSHLAAPVVTGNGRTMRARIAALWEHPPGLPPYRWKGRGARCSQSFAAGPSRCRVLGIKGTPEAAGARGRLWPATAVVDAAADGPDAVPVLLADNAEAEPLPLAALALARAAIASA